MNNSTPLSFQACDRGAIFLMIYSTDLSNSHMIWSKTQNVYTLRTKQVSKRFNLFYSFKKQRNKKKLNKIWMPEKNWISKAAWLFHFDSDWIDISDSSPELLVEDESDKSALSTVDVDGPGLLKTSHSSFSFFYFCQLITNQ